MFLQQFLSHSCNQRSPTTYNHCLYTVQTVLNVAAGSFCCTITLIWLGSSQSVPRLIQLLPVNWPLYYCRRVQIWNGIVYKVVINGVNQQYKYAGCFVCECAGQFNTVLNASLLSSSIVFISILMKCYYIIVCIY